MKSEFNTLWQKYGTFGILIIVMVVFGISQPVLFFSSKARGRVRFDGVRS